MDLTEIEKEVSRAVNAKEVENIRIKYLGKKGEIAKLFKTISNLPQEKKKERGKELNTIKRKIEFLIKKKEKAIRSSKIQLKFIDVTLPGEKISLGHIHPLSKVLQRCGAIFERMGFSVVEGPEVEDEWYNFDALNFPKDHPAREIQDTFWLKEKGKLLRTHTSPVQVRYMEKNKPPIKIVVPGRVFRYEATDASHEMQFYQLEGLMIDKDVSVTDFKGVVQTFFNEFFERKINIRLRPGYFPFTEPSFEIDIRGDKGKWLECAGAGMVHPNVLKNSGVDAKNWQGFAFGFGVDRITMIKHNINDIRLFYSSDLRFLNQF